MDQTQNDSFGSFSNNQGGYTGQPGVYSTAPIILDNGGVKKSKKWVWILIIVIFVAVGAVLFVLLLSRVSNNQSGNSASALFNRHANYLLFEETNNNNQVQSKYDDNYAYALKCEDKSADDCKSFFEEAENLLETFITANYIDEMEDDYKKEVEYYLQTFNNYYLYIKIGLLSGDTILHRYVDYGYNSTTNYIDEFYASYSNSSDSSLRAYGDHYASMAKTELDIIADYDESGCLDGYEYNQTCVANHNLSDAIIERLSILVKDDSVDKYIAHKKEDLAYGAIYVSKLLTEMEKNHAEN